MPVRGLGLLLLAALALARPAAGSETRKPAAELSAREIEECVQQNFPDDSMTQTMKMVMKDRMGVERLLEAEMFWEKDQATQLSKILLKFDNPPELRGAAVLVIEKTPTNDMFMFLPELGKTRRITSSMVNGNMMGTDFTYEDFARLQGMIGNLEATRAPDEQLAGRAAFVTESVPSDPSSEYTMVRSWVDQETCAPLQVEFFSKASADPVKRQDQHHRGNASSGAFHNPEGPPGCGLRVPGIHVAIRTCVRCRTQANCWLSAEA